MSAAKLSRAEIDRAGHYLGRRLLQVEASHRQGLLRAYLAAVPAPQAAAVEEAVVLALGDVVDGCEAISPRAREWVRDEVAGVQEPFGATEVGPHVGHTEVSAQ